MMIIPYIIDILSLVFSNMFSVILLPCLAFAILVIIFDILRRLIQV